MRRALSLDENATKLVGQGFDVRYPATRLPRQDSHSSSGLPHTACLPAVVRRGQASLMVAVDSHPTNSLACAPRCAVMPKTLAEIHQARNRAGVCHRPHRLDDDVEPSVRRATGAWKNSLRSKAFDQER